MCTVYVVLQIKDEEDRDHNENFGKNEISLLKDRLIQILQKPYDEKEYEALWEEVTRVGPVTRDRNLRHRIITYRTQANGKSYLDQFSGNVVIKMGLLLLQMDIFAHVLFFSAFNYGQISIFNYTICRRIFN